MKQLFLLCSMLCFVFSSNLEAQVAMSDFNTLFKAAVKKGGSGGSGGGGGAGGSGGPGMGGGGQNESVITTNLPSEGIFVKGATLVTWDDVGKAPYTVTVSNMGNEVFSKKTSDTWMAMDFSSMDLKAEKDYSISIVDSGDFKTNSIEIQFADKSSLLQAMGELMADDDYSNSTGVARELRKAIFLESKGFTLEASKAYNITTNNVKDTHTVANMHTAFLERNQ